MTDIERHFAEVYAEVCADLVMEPELEAMERQLKRFRDDLERVLGVQND